MFNYIRQYLEKFINKTKFEKFKNIISHKKKK